jgi:hypothetical protein
MNPQPLAKEEWVAIELKSDVVHRLCGDSLSGKKQKLLGNAAYHNPVQAANVLFRKASTTVLAQPEGSAKPSFEQVLALLGNGRGPDGYKHRFTWCVSRADAMLKMVVTTGQPFDNFASKHGSICRQTLKGTLLEQDTSVCGAGEAVVYDPDATSSTGDDPSRLVLHLDNNSGTFAPRLANIENVAEMVRQSVTGARVQAFDAFGAINGGDVSELCNRMRGTDNPACTTFDCSERTRVAACSGTTAAACHRQCVRPDARPGMFRGPENPTGRACEWVQPAGGVAECRLPNRDMGFDCGSGRGVCVDATFTTTGANDYIWTGGHI